MILERASQLKELIEGKRVLAKENINTAQEKQRAAQDIRNNTSTEYLPVDTQIRLRVEGLKGKLENRYRCRFWIVGRSKVGNYIIKNAKGEVLKEHNSEAKFLLRTTVKWKNQKKLNAF